MMWTQRVGNAHALLTKKFLTKPIKTVYPKQMRKIWLKVS